MVFWSASRHSRRSSGSRWAGRPEPFPLFGSVLGSTGGKYFLDNLFSTRGGGVDEAPPRWSVLTTVDCRPNETVEACGLWRGGGGSDTCDREGKGRFFPLFPTRPPSTDPYGE